MKRILIIDDHKVVRAGLRRMINDQTELALQRSAMFLRRSHSAPPEREHLFELAFYKHYVPPGRWTSHELPHCCRSTHPSVQPDDHANEAEQSEPGAERKVLGYEPDRCISRKADDEAGVEHASQAFTDN